VLECIFFLSRVRTTTKVNPSLEHLTLHLIPWRMSQKGLLARRTRKLGPTVAVLGDTDEKFVMSLHLFLGQGTPRRTIGMLAYRVETMDTQGPFTLEFHPIRGNELCNELIGIC